MFSFSLHKEAPERKTARMSINYCYLFLLHTFKVYTHKRSFVLINIFFYFFCIVLLLFDFFTLNENEGKNDRRNSSIFIKKILGSVWKECTWIKWKWWWSMRGVLIHAFFVRRNAWPKQNNGIINRTNTVQFYRKFSSIFL